MTPRVAAKKQIEFIVKDLTLNVLEMNGLFEELEKTVDFYSTNKRYIVLHHSFTEDSKTVSWNPIREYHKKVFNTDEIGYHFGIEEVREEGIYEVLYGRKINRKGAHCPQKNMNNLGIGFMFCGNFDIAPPPQDMLCKAADFIADLCIMTGISPNNIQGHREFNTRKTCPGKKFDIECFRNLVEERI